MNNQTPVNPAPADDEPGEFVHRVVDARTAPRLNPRGQNSPFDPRLADEPYPSTAQLWPIEAAAAYAGFSVRLLESSIDAGQIPVALHRLGAQRKRFVHIDQLKAWVRTRTAPQPQADANPFN
jgi:hypothetical protein